MDDAATTAVTTIGSMFHTQDDVVSCETTERNSSLEKVSWGDILHLHTPTHKSQQREKNNPDLLLLSTVTTTVTGDNDNINMSPLSSFQEEDESVDASVDHGRKQFQRQTSSSSSMRGSFSMQEQPNNKLPFDKLGIIGREKELRILHNAFRSLTKTGGLSAGQGLLDSGVVVPETALAASSTARTLVLISGDSGSGKSTLAGHLKESARHCFFVSGKCELQVRRGGQEQQQPYVAIKAAMISLCHQILALGSRSEQPRKEGDDGDSDPRQLSALRQLLLDGLGPGELQVLSNVIPNLKEVIGIDPAETIGNVPTNDGPDERRRALVGDGGYKEHGDRLKFSLRRFVQIICNYCPLVLVMDDLQWADKASLDLLQSWLLDTNNKAFMMIGCYRSTATDEGEAADEASGDDETNLLRSAIIALEESKRERSIRIINLELKDFAVEDIQTMLNSMVSSDMAPHASKQTPEDSVHQLALLVHQTTHGNPFFVRQFLHSLVQKGLLHFDTKFEHKWRWDIEEIEVATSGVVSRDITELLKAQLKQAQSACQVLPIAACLGTKFSLSTLCTVIRGLLIHSDHSAFFREVFNVQKFLSNSDIHKILKSAQRKGFLEVSKDQDEYELDIKKSSAGKEALMFNFTHDKVQEAALALIPEDKHSELRYKIGEILLSALSEKELEQKTFTVVNLLNERLDLVPDHQRGTRRMKIAMLNHAAGMQAVGCSAFRLAAIYFETAMKLLPNDCWKDCFHQSLVIYTSAAEIAFVVAEDDKARSYCKSIIDLDCPILKKVEAYHVLVDIAYTRPPKDDLSDDAATICLSLLKQLGCKFPTSSLGRSLATIKGMIRVKQTSRKVTKAMIAELPMCSDGTENAIMRTLDKISKTSYMSDPGLIPLAATQVLKRTLLHGMSMHSPPAFAFQGLVLGYHMGDFEGSQRCGQISLDMVKMVNGQNLESRLALQLGTMVFHWTGRWEDLKQMHFDAYKSGMACGDVESGVWNVQVYLAISLFSGGVPLSLVEEESSMYCKVMQDFQQVTPYQTSCMVWQFASNLRGNSVHTTQLIGDAFDERVKQFESNSPMSAFYNVTLQYTKVAAACYFGEYEVGAHIGADWLDEWFKKMPGANILPIVLYTSGVCFYGAWQSSQSRKYRKLGRRCRSQLKQWAKKGHQNCPHYISLLDAEDARSKGSSAAIAAGRYAKAIDEAADRKYIHDQALANERFSEFWLHQKEMEKAKHRLDEAMKLYGAWGADKKVSMLEVRRQAMV